MRTENIELPKRLLFVKKYMGLLSDAIYMLLFTVLLISAFLNKTQFQIPWMDWMQEENFRSYLIEHVLFHPRNVLLIALVCRYLFSCTYQIKEYLVTAVICLCVCYACGTGNGEAETVETFLLLLLGARELPFRKLIWWSILWTETLFVITVVGSQTGYVENLVYMMEGRNIRVSFGFLYPTIFAAQLFFIFLYLWYLFGERWNLLLSVAAILAAVFVYTGCEARFTTASFIVLSFVLGVRGMKIWQRKKQQKPYRMNNRMAEILVLFPLLCALGIHIMSICYQADVNWMAGLNQLVSNRLSLAKRAIQVYGFRLWGNDIPMNGYGGSTETQIRYFYLDSSYIQLSLISGLVVFGIVLFLLLTASYRAKKEHEWVLLWVLAFAGMHALFEEHLLSLSICPFLLAAVTQHGKKQRKTKKMIEKEVVDEEEKNKR